MTAALARAVTDAGTRPQAQLVRSSANLDRLALDHGACASAEPALLHVFSERAAMALYSSPIWKNLSAVPI
jgi:hypothetical protein